MASTLVTIFPGPGSAYRVRELASGTTQVLTMKWTSDEDAALDFISFHYSANEFVDKEILKDEVKRRRVQVVRNG